MEQNAELTREANRLYWQTDSSVADIADRLSVSRRALYDLVTPEAAGSACATCGGDVVYVNRSARSARAGRCQDCGAESAPGETNGKELEETVPPYAAGWPRTGGGAELRARALRLSGIALAGAALGTLAALLFVRRR